MSDDHLLPSTTHKLEDREARAFDFGRMTRRVREAVATPGSVAEVADLVCRARRDGIRLAIRGAGHSQGGQSLTDSGVVVDTTCLDRVQPASPELVRAQGGARWGDVVDALKDERRVPPVLVDVGEATVGGTLAAGGTGTTSHRYGAQVEQLEQLEVVTGTGERVLCSPTQNAGLFDAVRGGQGQFGIVTEAWMRLRPAGARFRQFELHYHDFERFAEDLDRMLVGLGAKSYLSGGFGYSSEQWEQHYGGMLKQGRIWKREFDPDHVFHPADMPFGAGILDSGPGI
ncbi:MAG: FAD-binding protein [bacterium]|nr:FAD-binding protein [bacterium]